jgi:hypothetical protein
MSRIYFEENQKFTQVWLWILTGSGLFILVGVAVATAYSQLIQGKTFGDKPMSDTGVMIFFISSILFSAFIILFMKSFQLQTKVDRLGITYRLLPLKRQWKTIHREEILDWEIVAKFAFQYGVHYGINSETLNIKGDKQLKLKLASGRTLFIGTQMPDQLSLALEEFFNRQPII